jgi:hypothetical protein
MGVGAAMICADQLTLDSVWVASTRGTFIPLIENHTCLVMFLPLDSYISNTLIYIPGNYVTVSYT